MTNFSSFIERPDDHNEVVEQVLAELFRENGNGKGVVPRSSTVDEFRAEEDAMDSVEMYARIEGIGRMIDWLYEAGPDPRTVMQRLTRLTNAYRPQHLCGMTDAQMARLFGETRAAQSWRGLQLITSKLHAAGAAGTRTRGQKSASACAKYSELQKGNKNRSKKPTPGEARAA